MRVGVIILPDRRWSESVERWRVVERLGYDSAWTYDHLWWRTLRDEPWYSCVPVLAAAAASTDRIRLGTLVSSPNFRHPALVAKETVTLDDISGGRYTLGIGAGSPGAGDANVISEKLLSPADRARRFEEFVSLTDRLLRRRSTTHRGEFYSAIETNMQPGCVQQPRVPFALAASGPRGFDLVARYGDAWVTVGPTDLSRSYTSGEYLKIVEHQLNMVRRACENAGRDFDSLDRTFIAAAPSGSPHHDVDSFLRMAEDYARLGMTDLIVRWPRASGVYAGDPDALCRIAQQALPQVHAF